jgi:micrococcal nuclease
MVFRRALLFLFLFIFSSPLPAAAKTLSGKVIKVFDGDTFLVQIQGRYEHVRLREIDAPEATHRQKLGQEPWGGRAKEFAQSWVGRKTVVLEIEEGEERDKYQRLLAYVFLGQKFINREMISSGNAFFFGGSYRGKRAVELQEAEEAAREKGLGVFNKKNGLKERPQEFRSRTQQVVANKRSMMYHLPGSPAAARISPRNRVLFATPEEAERAGFNRAKTGEAQR